MDRLAGAGRVLDIVVKNAQGPETGWRKALRALRFRDFRLIAIGNMVSEMGTWMQYVALGWVARELTSDTLLISIVFGVQWLPYLVLSPITGVIADRLDRRKIIFWGNIAMILPALALGLMIQTERITMFWLIVLVTLGGAAQACTRPAGLAFIPALVPNEDLHSALALNAGMSSSTRVIGPAIGGFLVSSWGLHGDFTSTQLVFWLSPLRVLRFVLVCPSQYPPRPVLPKRWDLALPTFETIVRQCES